MVEANAQGLGKTCYYELLGVDRKATTKEIVKGYRKAALKWHPDKNPGVDTKEKFQEIQAANQCLMDENERAWYDTHRDQILMGKSVDDADEKDASYFTKSKLKPYMKESCFKGYDSAKEPEKNFYTFYHDLFAQLDTEEELEEMVGTEHYKVPLFGGIDATMQSCKNFYEYWSTFCTIKQFSYVDLYNPNDCPNRRVKRLVEADNKRERMRERSKFNDTVHELLRFVKQHDHRYQNHLTAEVAERQ